METPLNNRRRLERHSRRDGDIQWRARPAGLQESDASYVRRMVEKAHEEGGLLRRQILGIGGGNSSNTPSSSGSNGSSGNNNTNTSDGNDTPSGNPNTTPINTTPTPRTTTTRTTSTSTRTSTTPTSTSTTSTTERTTSSSRTSTTTSRSSTTSLSPTTTVAYVLPSTTSSSSVAISSSTSTAKASSGVGAGPIIGIVAGALAGVAILVVLIGFLIKKFSRKEDPYEADPFDRDDFTRHSAMLPDTFESEDGHPSMAEYGSNMHSVGGYGGDAGYAGAGAGAGAFAGGMAASSSFNAHNEGGPRPPSMFQKHINGPGAQYNMSDAPPAPQIGAIYGARDPTPQIPPMAFGGSDPYSMAGVGRNHQVDSNINNPYAHLDRSISGDYAAQPNQYEGRDMYGDLDRHGSQGSSYPQHSSEKYHSGEEMESAGHGFDTAGRPGTSEGRSGTPDLPNVQQTYAMGAGAESEHHHHQHEREQRMAPQDMNRYNAAGQSLQVRNLLPNTYDQQHQQQQYYAQQRPLSNVSSQPGDDDAAYGGVW